MSLAARGRLLLHRSGLVIAAVCVLLALASGVMAVQAIGDPPTETVTEEVNIEEFAFDSHTEATVDGNNITLYEPGERLVDMPVYFHGESPEMDLIIGLDAPEGTQLDVRVTAELVAQRDDRTFYEESILLASDRVVADGGAEVVAPIDIPHLRTRIDRVSARITGVGSLDERVAVTVDYESDRYSGTLADDVNLQVGQAAYWLGTNPGDDDRRSEVTAHEVELDRDLSGVGTYGFAALVLLLIGGLCARYARHDLDVESLQTEIARSEFDEWISSGEIPTRAGKQYVKVDSLEDVVDIAIDTNKRVIHDRALDAFGVIDGDLVYYYSPGADEIEEWLEL